MSTLQSLQKIAYCNPNKSTDLITCSESVYEILTETVVGLPAALERLFYLVKSCEGLEHKARRGIITPRDPMKLDLEHNIKKCLDKIQSKISSSSWEDMVVLVLRWCFKTLSQVNTDSTFKLSSNINRIMLSAADRLYKRNASGYLDEVFQLFVEECPDAADSAILVKILNPYPALTTEIVRKSFYAYTNKQSVSNFFALYKYAISDLSKYNCNLVSSAVTALLEEESCVKEKIGFVLNVLRSIPALQSVSVMLLYESQAFKKLMNSSKDALSPGMVDDLAKLFLHSQVNSYSSIMSLLEQDPTSSLGPRLLENILLNIELAMYGVNDSQDKSITFIDNMSSAEDIRMFCRCLSVLKPSTHPYILKCLSIICVYKGNSVSKSVVSQLMLTQPLEKFESLISTVKGIYPTVCLDCFKWIIRDIKNVTMKQADLFVFFENTEKLKLHGHHEITSRDMVSVALVLRDCNNFKFITLLLKFLDPKAMDISDTILITDTLTESFVRRIMQVSMDDVNIELLEIIEDLKSNILKWCPINDCIRLSVLRKVLALITTEDLFLNEEKDNDAKGSLIESLKSAVIESEDKLHSGQIRKKVKVQNKKIVDVIAIQNVMNLIQSLIGPSPKAGKELCTFLLDTICPDCNLEAPWPEVASMKYTIERDLNVLKSFEKVPILWNLFEEALTTKHSDLVVIVRALLVVLISFWSSSRVNACVDSPQNLAYTVKLLDLLSGVEWLPPPLLNISQLIILISPYEAMTLLYEVSHHFKVHAPHMNRVPVIKYQPSLRETVLKIVQNNIENVGVTAFLFSRWGLGAK